jgi:hypothetical protein
VTTADGWRLLCAELSLDPDEGLEGLPGYDAVRQTVEVARLMKVSAEEALEYMCERAEAAAKGTPPGPGEFHIDTAEDVARAMRAALTDELAE